MVPDRQRSFTLLSASVPRIMSVSEPNRTEMVQCVALVLYPYDTEAFRYEYHLIL